MKKLTAIILSLIFAFSLAGCYDEAGKVSPQEPPEQGQEDAPQQPEEQQQPEQKSKQELYDEYFAVEKKLGEYTGFEPTIYYGIDDEGYLYYRSASNSEEVTQTEIKASALYQYDDDVVFVQDGDIFWAGPRAENPRLILSRTGEITRLSVNPELIFFIEGDCLYRYHIASETLDLLLEQEELADMMVFTNYKLVYSVRNQEYYDYVIHQTIETGSIGFDSFFYDGVTDTIRPAAGSEFLGVPDPEVEYQFKGTTLDELFS